MVAVLWLIARLLLDLWGLFCGLVVIWLAIVLDRADVAEADSDHD